MTASGLQLSGSVSTGFCHCMTVPRYLRSRWQLGTMKSAPFAAGTRQNMTTGQWSPVIGQGGGFGMPP